MGTAETKEKKPRKPLPTRLTLEQKKKKREREHKRYQDKKLAARKPRVGLPKVDGRKIPPALQQSLEAGEGQVVVAQIVPEDGNPLPPREERDFSNVELGEYTVPRGTVNKANAPDLITLGFCRAVRALLMTGKGINDVCRIIGITPATLYEWQQVAPWLKQHIDEGVDQALIVGATEGLYRRAIGCKVQEVLYERNESGRLIEVKRIIKEIPPDPRAQSFALTNRDAKRWGRAAEAGVTVVINAPEISRDEHAGSYTPDGDRADD